MSVKTISAPKRQTIRVTRNDVLMARRVMVKVRFSRDEDGWIPVSKTAMYDILKHVAEQVDGEFDKKLDLWIGYDE